MKKTISLLLCLLLAGCSTNAVSKEEYDTLLKEKNTLELEVNNLKSSNEKLTEKLSKYGDIVDVKISGGFVATVIGQMADPDSGSSAKTVLTIKFFQGNYEIIKVSEKIAGQIKSGETYYFEVEPIVVEKDVYGMTVKQVASALGDNIDANGWVSVKSIRVPNEDELGIAETLIVEEEK